MFKILKRNVVDIEVDLEIGKCIFLKGDFLK